MDRLVDKDHETPVACVDSKTGRRMSRRKIVQVGQLVDPPTELPTVARQGARNKAGPMVARQGARPTSSHANGSSFHPHPVKHRHDASEEAESVVERVTARGSAQSRRADRQAVPASSRHWADRGLSAPPSVSMSASAGG